MNKNLTKITKSALAALPLVVMLLLANIVNAQNPIVVKFANNGMKRPLVYVHTEKNVSLFIKKNLKMKVI